MYKVQLTFRVQHEIVSGLKSSTGVYRKGIRGAQRKSDPLHRRGASIVLMGPAVFLHLTSLCGSEQGGCDVRELRATSGATLDVLPSS